MLDKIVFSAAKSRACTPLAEPAMLVGGALVGRGGQTSGGPQSKASAFRPALTMARSSAGVVEGLTPYGTERLERSAPADAAGGTQRTSGRPRRARQHGGLCSAA